MKLEQEFEALCRHLFDKLGYVVDPASWQNWGVDIRAVKDTVIVMADVRFTHRPMVYPRLLSTWVPAIARLDVSGARKPVLIVSGIVSRENEEWITSQFQLEVWDRKKLLEKGDSVGLSEILRAFFFYCDESTGPYDPAALLAARQTIDEFFEKQDLRVLDKRRGEELFDRLDKLPKGTGAGRSYERLCREILDYLFAGPLVNPIEQKRTQDGLDIFDIVYSINPIARHPIWDAIARDFRARVVMFECKNYGRAIGPMQVFTTERYMSIPALRSICFLLTRFKPSNNAFLAAHAAMRDSGKMIILLDDDDLRRMLMFKDEQSLSEPGTEAWFMQDPSVHLEALIYRFLSSLGR
ncbi:hypothetical protein E0J02_26570 [Rhizobium leguminosarum bv. viciae]|nr:hypothetical protein E0J02_26570 [Rhizobium leguminosarum bv. viciae]